MRVIFPLLYVGAIVAAVAMASPLASCHYCATSTSSQPTPDASSRATAVVVTPGANAISFAVWTQSLHECDPLVSAPSMHVVEEERTSTSTAFGPITRVVQAGSQFVAIGRLGSRSAVLVGPIDDPSRARTTRLSGFATSLVASADRAFFLEQAKASVRAMGADVDVDIPAGGYPTALTAVGGYVYAVLPTGVVTEIDAQALIETRRIDACPAYAAAPFGPGALLLACDPAGLGILDLQTGTLAVTSTDERFSLIRGTTERGVALVATHNSARVFVAGFGLIGDGATEEGFPYGNDEPLSDALFVGSNAVASFQGRLLRFSLVSGTASPFGLGGRIDVLSGAGTTGVAVGAFPPTELGLVRFDLETGDAGEVLRFSPPPAYYRRR